MTRIGFVGAGRMGAPMVRRLVESGHAVRALGRTAEKRHAATSNSVRRRSPDFTTSPGKQKSSSSASSPTSRWRRCALPACSAAMSPGAALVVHTTGSPRTVQAIAAHSPGIDVLDAPVSGGPHDIAAGALTLFVGGPDDAVVTRAAGARELRRPDPARRPPRGRPGGEADQQRAVRRADRAAQGGRRAGRPAGCR